MPAISVRWSEQEARKPYARPFMVSFTDDAGEPSGAVAVSGADLLYYRQFQTAVLALAGELFVDAERGRAGGPPGGLAGAAVGTAAGGRQPGAAPGLDL